MTVIVQDGETKKLPLNMMVTKQDIENKKIAGLAKLDEIEATYENDTYTPTITVKNKSSVKVGEGDGVDYSANVMDGHVKSAILKGSTKWTNTNGDVFDAFFNPVTNFDFENGYLKTDGTLTYDGGHFATQFIDITNFDGIEMGKEGVYYGKLCFYDGDKNFIAWVAKEGTTGIVKVESIPSNAKYIRYSAITKDIFIKDNEGRDLALPLYLVSVKMPVLTTTGKNLFNYFDLVAGAIIWDTSNNVNIFEDGWYQEGTDGIGFRLRKCIKVKPNTKYYANFPQEMHVMQYKANGDLIKGSYPTISTGYVTTSSETHYINLFPSGGISSVWDEAKRQEYQNCYISESKAMTSYEPYKSNILTTPSDLELRGIGEVRDTLDLLTCELTERIGEIVLDGSEKWNYSGDHVSNEEYIVYHTGITVPINSSKLGVANNLPYDAEAVSITSFTKECIYINSVFQTCYIRIKRERGTIVDYLTSNPITVQYELEAPTIKTVDLMPSGTHPSTTPYCWKNGLIQLSSSGLLPNLEYSVVTSRAGQINQNATMIVKNDKRIFDLEILLAGGLVNTTYQALTLQNQVETGLSKVSLNSETEPDYLLYHMIMKLIEEKAYKLDDLTEKVSVFYLYEKLSDTQFETIYSALYPFAEDEIIEEPCVD